MKKQFIWLIAILGAFLSSAQVVFASNYYVAGDTGLDTNDGSISSPWQTIQKAADTMVAGDTVNVKGGITYSIGKNDCTYYGLMAATVCLSRSGTVNNYITYRQWEGTGYPIIEPTGSMFAGLGADGFVLSSATTAINYTKISGFYIKNAKSGIRISGIGNFISNNIIVNNTNMVGTMGISIGASESETIQIFNNTIYGSTYGIGSISGGQATIKNNIIFNSITYGIFANTNGWKSISLDNNNVFGAGIANYNLGLLPVGDHSLSVDPKFVDPTADNFQLQATSPLIDAGVTLSEVATDITGVSRPQGNSFDLGAFESSYSQSNPPNTNSTSNYSTPTNSLTQLAIYTGEPEITDGNSQFAFWNSFSNIAIGDVNGDGIDDLLTGARHYDPSGGLYIFYGKFNLIDTPAANADVIYRSNTVEHGFAENLSIGDLDLDGIGDILATNYGRSKAFLFKGGNNLVSETVLGAAANVTGASEFGFGSTILGDINGDGYQDYAIRDNGSPAKIYVYLGNGTFVDQTASSASFTITTGTNVIMLSRPGDINHDGFTDIVFGCPGWCGTSRVYIFLGKSSDWVNKDYSDADVIYTSTSDNSLGSWVNLADVNGDSYDDVISTGNQSIDIFYGQQNPTSKLASQADVIITASSQFPFDPTLGKSAIGVDMNNDGIKDLAFSSSVGPKTYVVYGSPTLDSKNASQADLVFDAISAWGAYYGGPMESGDLNGDGYADIAIGAGMYNMRQGRAYVLTSPHGSPTITLSSGSSLSSPTISGSVTDTLTVGAVEVSIDSGSWSSCTVVSDKFTCTLPSTLSEGSHAARLRSHNSLGVYMATREYATSSFIYDHTPPSSFSSHAGSNIMISDVLPTFSFDKSSDSLSGLSKYQILLDGSVYIDNINTDTTSVTGTTKLESGKSYKWKVRAIDNAGNTTTTDEKIIRINTRTVLSSSSSSSFPLTILTLGGKPTNITSLHEDQVPKVFSISTSTPTIYGIANSGTQVSLRLERDNNEHSGRVRVFESTTTTGSDSRYGINVTDKLVKGDYYLSLSAKNNQGDYIELPEFTLRVGVTLNLLTKRTTPPISRSITPVQTILETTQPDPTPSPSIAPVETKQPKKCFLWWCW